MSYSRRHANPGKRERQARKRRFRATVTFITGGAVYGPFKVGRKHSGRIARRDFGSDEALAVADAETLGKGTEEPVRQFTLQEDPPGHA